MSRLYATERGRVVRALGEELTASRRARKVLDLPATSEPAHLYILAWAHAPAPGPLHVMVNGKPLHIAEADTPGTWHWIDLVVPADQLRPGENTFEFRTGSTAMTSWSIAMEPGHADPASQVSDDGGTRWRNSDMGYLNSERGEYVVRIRLAEGDDPVPPAMIPEDLSHPRCEALRSNLPADALGDAPLFDRARAISAWIAGTFEHRSSDRAAYYAPWDTETILAWGAAGFGHAGRPTVTMCVHFAAAFVGACQVAGIDARCAITTEAIDGGGGHCIAEVWFPDLAKWVMFDPNMDYVVRDGDNLLSLPEIRALGPGIGKYIEPGAGYEFQLRYEHMQRFVTSSLEANRCFKHQGIWPRTDLLSNPRFSPPDHGSLNYCETDIVWEERSRGDSFGMFQYFGDEEYFNAPPRGSRSG